MGKNLLEQNYSVNREDKNELKKHPSYLLMFTGLSGSGKSTISNLVELELHKLGLHTISLDGDNLRIGLNSDLGFSLADRKENLRRVGELSKLLIDNGLISIAAFISPMKNDREMIKKIVGSKNYIEIYINTSLEICENRDVKGLYAKARKGEISDFTGISSPYEAPENPDIEINTQKISPEEGAFKILEYLKRKHLL